MRKGYECGSLGRVSLEIKQWEDRSGKADINHGKNGSDYKYQLMSRKQGKKREKYRKIPLKMKVQLLRKIIEEGQSIKKVATEFKINYSTAKTLYRNEKLRKSKNSLAELALMGDSGSEVAPTSHETLSNSCGYLYIPSQMEMGWSSRKVEGQNSNRKVTQVEIVSKVSFPNIF